jgi:hypothetical protein
METGSIAVENTGSLLSDSIGKGAHAFTREHVSAGEETI